MPPTGALRPEEITTIKTWIDQGAEWPDELAGETPSPPRESVGDAGAGGDPARRSPESRAVAEGEPAGGARDGIRWHHAADVRRTLWRHAVGAIAARDGRGPERAQRCRRHRAAVGRGRSRDDATAARAPCRSERAIAGRPHAIAGGRRPCRCQRDRERAPRPRCGQGHGADRTRSPRRKDRGQGGPACADREDARGSASACATLSASAFRCCSMQTRCFSRGRAASPVTTTACSR